MPFIAAKTEEAIIDEALRTAALEVGRPAGCGMSEKTWCHLRRSEEEIVTDMNGTVE